MALLVALKVAKLRLGGAIWLVGNAALAPIGWKGLPPVGLLGPPICAVSWTEGVLTCAMPEACPLLGA